MSETLLDVIIGGVITAIGGIVINIPTLVYNERRWKKEKELEYLRTERSLLKEQYLNIFINLDACIKGSNQSKDIRTRVGLFLPNEVREQVYAFLDEEDPVRRELFRLAIASLMKKSLDEIEKEIKESMS